ncbi:MAG: nucleotidyl transferase AbiEii/AbiGii toxin family protein [bacterium]
MTRKIDPAKIQSIRDRLKNKAHEYEEDFNLVVIRYVLERLLYRLSRSNYADKFVLKGATLFVKWYGELHRPTRDADFTLVGKIEEKGLVEVVKEFCEMEVNTEDGVIFLTDTVKSQQIRATDDYQGIRIHLQAQLGSQKVKVQLDIGFGDSLVPKPEMIDYPSLLDLPVPKLRACQPETAIAEKFQNMVEMGIGNSRMKDFYDIWFLSKKFKFTGKKLQNALRITFNRRKIELPKRQPLVFSEEFIDDEFTTVNWHAFLKKLELSPEELPLKKVISRINDFLMPPTEAAARQESFAKKWQPSRGWTNPNNS